MEKPSPLRLFAEDAEGLQIISSMTQDGLAKMNKLIFDKKHRRFTVEMNRFNWEKGVKKKPYFRTHSLLAIDSVLNVRGRKLPATTSEEIVSLLAIVFEPAEIEPEGKVRLQFSNDGEIELDVECIDLSMIDTDTSWPTTKKPRHKIDLKKVFR
ncbi:DUF2948 family protein [Hirschia litorea]|uniref:DUF2948 family protein n=1 Tax=Hirschia litorea TaxID=1199156 RepID=A0ABW2IH63_9PROT